METLPVFEFPHNATISLQPTFGNTYTRDDLDKTFITIDGLYENGLPTSCYLLAIVNETNFTSVCMGRTDNCSGWEKGRVLVNNTVQFKIWFQRLREDTDYDVPIKFKLLRKNGRNIKEVAETKMIFRIMTNFDGVVDPVTFHFSQDSCSIPTVGTTLLSNPAPSITERKRKL